MRRRSRKALLTSFFWSSFGGLLAAGLMILAKRLASWSISDAVLATCILGLYVISTAVLSSRRVLFRRQRLLVPFICYVGYFLAFGVLGSVMLKSQYETFLQAFGGFLKVALGLDGTWLPIVGYSALPLATLTPTFAFACLSLFRRNPDQQVQVLGCSRHNAITAPLVVQHLQTDKSENL